MKKEEVFERRALEIRDSFSTQCTNIVEISTQSITTTIHLEKIIAG